jgi:hypothetical protein
LIEKKLTTTASHFQDIYGKWNESAPVGIFWTWGGWNNLEWYDYLITEDLKTLSNDNLYEKWARRAQRSVGALAQWAKAGWSIVFFGYGQFHVHFMN